MLQKVTLKTIKTMMVVKVVAVAEKKVKVTYKVKKVMIKVALAMHLEADRVDRPQVILHLRNQAILDGEVSLRDDDMSQTH